MEQICGVFPLIRGSDDNEKDLSKPEMCNEDEGLISPFIKYSADGYCWPSLYTELDECIESCVLIYPLAELRKMARANEIDNPEKVLTLPLTHSQVMDVVKANKDKLTDTKFGDESGFYRDILATAEERNMIVVSNSESRSEEEEGSPQRVRIAASEIIAFDDEFAKEELVYSIEVHHKRKQILVCFRGSVTKKDWATDFEIFMKEVPNPIKDRTTLPNNILVHSGFHDYLFEANSRGVQGPNGEPLSEYQEIMQHILPVLKNHPGYKLYVTGHSLGAALATLFAFEAAAEDDALVPKPVSCFSIAGPYVGDESFRSAHQVLEAQGKLRHLRVSNHKDVVTLVPKMSFRWQFYDPDSHVGSLFKHVGMNLRLYEDDDNNASPEFRYPKVRSGFWSSTMDELSRGWEQTMFTNLSWPSDYWTWPFHSLREYNRRAMAKEPALHCVQLNDLYTRKDVVGVLVPQF